MTYLRIAWELAKIQDGIENESTVSVWFPFNREFYFIVILIVIVYLRIKEVITWLKPRKR